MQLRFAVLPIVSLLFGLSPAEAQQDTAARRAAAADHRACVASGYKSRSVKYTACRRTLVARRAAAQRDDTGWHWWGERPFARACQAEGYRPGTAAFDRCLRQLQSRETERARQEDDARRQQEQDRQNRENNCFRHGMGLTTPLGGSSFSIFCPGSSRTIVCPGDISCPVCPGGAGCPPPPTPVCPGGIGCPPTPMPTPPPAPVPTCPGGPGCPPK